MADTSGGQRVLEDCPCCTEPTHDEDFRTVNGRLYCAWCDENGCPKDALDDEAEASKRQCSFPLPTRSSHPVPRRRGRPVNARLAWVQDAIADGAIQEVGASYCTLHDGLMNEDDSQCDFAVTDIEMGDTLIDEDGDDTGEPRPCHPRQLYFVVEQSDEPREA